ncbi:hypothetical protein Csa_016662 [Cucumis sativus]|nr:hypothetical protein Csa_016662 [Cucumis sativus]
MSSTGSSPWIAAPFGVSTIVLFPEFDFKFNSSESPAVREALDSYCNDRRRSYEFFNWVESECKFDHATETQTRMLDILVSEAIAAYEGLREFKLRDETSFCNLIDALYEGLRFEYEDS